MRLLRCIAAGSTALLMIGTASAGEWYGGLAGAMVDNQPEIVHSVSPEAGLGWFTVANRAAVNAAPVDDLSSNGAGVSVLVGYQGVLSDSFFLGAEGDLTLFNGDAEKSATANYPNPPGAFTIKQELNQSLLMSLRARLGISLDVADVFVTGGLALTDYDLTGTFSDTYPLGSRILAQGANAEGLQAGFVYGGGVDAKIWSSTKIRLEYLKYEFDDVGGYDRSLTFNTGSATPGPEHFRGEASLNSEVIRLGLVFGL